QDLVSDAIDKFYETKKEAFGEKLHELERVILLRVVDQKWMDHLDAMEQLKQGISYRAYAQKDPVVEYKFEGMAMFEEMVETIKEEVVRLIFHASPATNIERKQVAQTTKEGFVVGDAALGVPSDRSAERPGAVGASTGRAPAQEPVRVEKIGRNELCPCGSGKKYKHCCGQES
ncbi:MAG: SEC-C metal-binding domain-containing protein, partial [Oscillospiraceae bacterium]|nr:SEC-C metal-binding domain-containing protein [Oscillospiraceae bacterium]